MIQKTINALGYIKSYLIIVISGLYFIYNVLLLKLFMRLKLFNFKEIIYFVLIGYSIILTGIGWRSYKILINDEMNQHTIATNDFLIFLIGFIIMFIPGIFKILMKFDHRYLAKLCFSSGLLIVTIFYILNILKPSRISATPEATFTVWFYLFGVNVIFFWIMGIWVIKVPGIFSMPSTHLKN
ncbi:MAG: hypothetical protein OEV78_00995 [Spirochaetia bacterium]|nr:hypothetical protein [Spirochaetia bacterium]